MIKKILKTIGIIFIGLGLTCAFSIGLSSAFVGCSPAKVYAEAGDMANHRQVKKVQGNINNLTGTTWTFNNTPSIPPISLSNIEYNIAFTSNNNQYAIISLGDDPQGDYGSSCITYYTTNYGSYVLAFYGSSWDSDYKTITITGGSDSTNSTLINWLDSNATLQGGVGSYTTTIRFYDGSNNPVALFNLNGSTYDKLGVGNSGSENGYSYIRYLNNSYVNGGYISSYYNPYEYSLYNSVKGSYYVLDDDSVSIGTPFWYFEYDSTQDITYDIYLYPVNLYYIIDYASGDRLSQFSILYNDSPVVVYLTTDKLIVEKNNTNLYVSNIYNSYSSWVNSTNNLSSTYSYDSTKNTHSNPDSVNIIINDYYALGYNVGNQNGYQAGYTQGLIDGDVHPNNFLQETLNMVSTFFNTEIFPNFKLMYLVYIGLGALVIGFIWKIFLH